MLIFEKLSKLYLVHRTFDVGSRVFALLDVDQNWHEATVMSYDMKSYHVRVRFEQWNVERILSMDQYSAMNVEEVDRLCELCLRQRKYVFLF